MVAFAPTTKSIGSCSRDPIGYVGDRNLVSFVANTPYRFVDPMGLDKVPPGVLPSDGLNPGDSFCCNGKRGIVGKQCCVPNITKGATDGPFLYNGTEQTTRKVCWRKAQVLGGGAGTVFGLYHMWMKCEFAEVGLGEQGGGVPGVDEDAYPTPFPPTSVNDHTGKRKQVVRNALK